MPFFHVDLFWIEANLLYLPPSPPPPPPPHTHTHTHTHKVVRGVYWFHSSRPSVRPTSCVRSVAPNSSGWIHFIFIHLIKQLQKVCHVESVLQNFKIEIFGNFLYICNYDFVLSWLGIWCESLVWVIMGRQGVSQNAGILVVLVWHLFHGIFDWWCWCCRIYVTYDALESIFLNAIIWFWMHWGLNIFAQGRWVQVVSHCNFENITYILNLSFVS